MINSSTDVNNFMSSGPHFAHISPDEQAAINQIQATLSNAEDAAHQNNEDEAQVDGDGAITL